MIISMMLEVVSLGVVYPIIKIIVDKDSLGDIFFNKLDFLADIEMQGLIVSVLIVLIIVFLLKTLFYLSLQCTEIIFYKIFYLI